jgi:metal-responsive CopG/Arc/MetJ family transcriptional regulator
VKNTSHDANVVHMPPDLLAEAHRAADEEHRPTDELVSEAVRRYLRERNAHEAAPRTNLAQLLMDSPFAGADLDLERRKDYPRPIEL